MVVNLDSHLDADFCREMGEQLLTVDVPKSLLLKSNGSQGNVYRNNQRVMELHRLGLITARSGLNSGALRTAGRLVDLLCMVAYPKNLHRVDPPNMWPTCKPVIDGMTEAGLWIDDDSSHIRRTSFQQDPTPTGTQGLWRITFHIIPIQTEGERE